MNFDQYKPLALRTEKPLPTQMARIRHALLGLITETGEWVTEVKRIVIYGKPLDAERRAHIAEEIGDTFWYLAILADASDHEIVVPYTVDNLTLENLSFIMASNVGMTASLVLEADVTADYSIEFFQQVHQVSNNMHTALYSLCRTIEMDAKVICAENIAKLRERFPDAYTDAAAEARADKDGADARNS